MIATLDTGRIEALLADRIGLDPASIGRDEISRAVRRRMQEIGCPTLADYLILVEYGEEWDEFVEHVLVRETWFFREPAAFALLDRLARAHAATGQPRTFRVLSMPCSTGAEPYSVAMTLREAGLGTDRFRVDAVDLSRQALDEARRAIYPARVVRLVPPRLLQRCFTPTGDAWQVTREARRGVHFSRGNVVDPDVLRGSVPFDVVFCRNVLIYLDPAARQRLLATLSHLLRNDGVLVTGHAETSNVVAPLFTSAGLPRTFAYLKSPRAPTVPQGTRDRGHSGARSSSAREPRAEPRAATRKPSVARAKRPVASVERGEPSREGAPAETLDGIRALADAGRLGEAMTACEAWLEQHPTSSEGQFLLGITASAAGHSTLAEHALRRTLYLDPAHEPALLHLATLRERAGDQSEAARLRRRAGRTPNRHEGGA
jgi:chemotaxis protein methyltransferase WspC